MVVDSFDDDWLVSVQVHRSKGSDDNGDPLPDEVIPIGECLIGERTSTKTDRASDVVTAALSLFRDPDPEFAFESTDRIVVPKGAMNAGSYLVDGHPRVTPLGVEVPLKGVGR